MKLNWLELTNVCQFEQRNFHFEDGLVGIYGPNGSGKSNSMISAYAALTNDYSRHLQGKDGMIRQQAGSEDKSQILLNFSHRDHEYTLERGLRNPSRHRLILPGGETLKKATEIAGHLEAAVGIKRRLIDDFIFVGQSELFAFLSATPANRAKSFAHLCGTTHAETCWEFVGKEISEMQPLADMVVDSGDEVRSEIAEYKSKMAADKRAMRAAEDEMLVEEDLKTYQKLLAQHDKHQAAVEDLQKLKKSVVSKSKAAKTALAERMDFDREVEQLRTQARDQKRAVDVAKASWDTIGPDRDEAVRELARVQDMGKRIKRKKQVKDKLAEAKRKREGLCKPEEISYQRLSQLELECKELEAKIREAGTLIENFAEGGVAACPTCGTPTSKLENRIEAAKLDMPVWSEHLATARAAVEEMREAEAELSAYEEAVEKADGVISSLEERLEDFADVKPIVKGTTASLKARVAACDEAMAAWEEAREKLDELHEDFQHMQSQLELQLRHVATANANLRSAKDAVKQQQRKISELEVDEDELKEARALLDAHRKAQASYTQAETLLESRKDFIRSRERELERINKRMVRSSQAGRWIEVLTDVRDRVLHRDQLPRIVHQNYLLNMVADINSVLEEFSAPFHVEVSRDVGFTAHFANGTVMPAPGLSGGQKVVLALAFRLTVNSLFAPQLGTMILDEPTDGLDAENKELAAEFFQRLGVLARARGLQIIVITHDEEMERILDQKITLERP